MSAEVFGSSLLQEVHEIPLSAVSRQLRPFLIGKHTPPSGVFRHSIDFILRVKSELLCTSASENSLSKG